jgi:hypothetical protein
MTRLTDAQRQAAYRVRKRAAGYRQLHGTWTLEPHQNMRPNQEPEHGTANRYRWRQNPCRCRPCRDAINEYNRAYRKRKRGNR